MNRDELESSDDQGEAELRQWDGELAKLLKSTMERVPPVETSSSHENAGTADVSGVNSESDDVKDVKCLMKSRTRNETEIVVVEPVI